MVAETHQDELEGLHLFKAGDGTAWDLLLGSILFEHFYDNAIVSAEEDALLQTYNGCDMDDFFIFQDYMGDWQLFEFFSVNLDLVYVEILWMWLECDGCDVEIWNISKQGCCFIDLDGLLNGVKLRLIDAGFFNDGCCIWKVANWFDLRNEVILVFNKVLNPLAELRENEFIVLRIH